ncbi:MAG: helix-turn-helix domain-containing protein [Lachnospiraceae bacterium]|nr:helix-turn-helix domain-containing protein [Lachnospiraceae bacterium]
MDKKGVSQYQLLKNKVLDNKTLDSLKKNKNITLLTLERLCKALECTPNDIVKFDD